MNAVQAEVGNMAEEGGKEARKLALQAVSRVAVEPALRVSYRSQGRLLLIGKAAAALDACAVLKPLLRCFVLAWGEGISQVEGDIPILFIGQGVKLEAAGYMGEFRVTLRSQAHTEVNLARLFEADFNHFDLILDLGTPALLNWEIAPLGYYAPRDEQDLQRALAELPELVGEFEKARFVHYDPAICVHGGSGLRGCRRCLDVCPAGAIRSLVDKIAVDPYLCQGAGACATACPSGAIIYHYPKPAATLERLRRLLHTYRQAGGRDAVLLFHEAEARAARLAVVEECLPDNWIPLAVEELGGIGMDIWLAALAYGAGRVLLLATTSVPPGVLGELKTQLRFARALLEGMAYPATVLRLVDGVADDASLLQDLVRGPGMPPIEPADFAGGNAKRDTLYAAIDHLASQASWLTPVIALPAQAPFGEIQLDRDACTLCMACVSVCPVSALFAGVDTPKLELLEAACVQCGLCEQACPEQAISLHPRFVFDSWQRHQRRLLHEEAAFHCVVCGNPFATRRLIDKITGTLQGHAMFQDAAALRRLQMCGDCRVRDLFGQGLKP